MNDLNTLTALIELARTLSRDKVSCSLRLDHASGFTFRSDSPQAPGAEPESSIAIELRIVAPESLVRDAINSGIVTTAFNRLMTRE